MAQKIGKTYIKKGRKAGFLIMLTTLIVIGIVIAVIQLLPGNVPEIGYSEQNGLGRSFMYPFVFTDSQSQLYVLKEDNSVVPVDNNVSYSLHDSSHDRIYYVSENNLYEYSLKTNDRVALCESVVKFSLLGNRRGVVYTDNSNRVLMYLFKGKENVLLSAQENAEEPYYAVCDEGVIFADGTKLKYCDYLGKIKELTQKLNTSKKFYISSDNENICFYEDSTLVICKTNGKVVKKLQNGQPVVSQDETALIYPGTNELKKNDGIAFKYFLSNIGQVEAEQNNPGMYNAGNLHYFDGKEFKEVAKDIYKVIYYSKDDNFLLYTVLNKDKMDVYMTSKGAKPKKQITCDVGSNFMFDNKSKFLYFRDEESTLWRYDIYDVNFKKVKIAENTGNIYDYYNKPFVAYTDKEQKFEYLVLKDKIVRAETGTDIRLYGRSHETYLLCKQNTNGLVTLDYVFEDRLTRIANNISSNIYFDKDIEYAIYNENQKMYLWHGGNITYIGDYESVKAVDII